MSQFANPNAADTAHRYTGPELGALLAKVRAELGTEANIVEANRIRSGGVAGFFARESYELVAARADDADDGGRAGDSQPDTVAEARTPVIPPPVPREQRPGSQGGQGAGVSMALLERAEAVSARERAVISRRSGPAPDDGRARSAPARFGDLLEAELHEPELIETEAILSTDEVDVRDGVVTPPPAPAALESPEPVLLPVHPEPGSHPAPTPQAEPALEARRAPASHRAPAPQAEPAVEARPAPVSQPEAVVDARPPARPVPGSAIVTVVGELATALELAASLESGAGSEAARHVVLTTADEDGSQLAGHRPGTVGRYYEQVSGRLFSWLASGQRAIAVVDAAIDGGLATEIRCLSALGAGEVHLACRSEDEAVDLLDHLEGYDGRVVVNISDGGDG